MYIGQDLDRVDARLKVTGRAKYSAEFSPPGAVHAVLVQSTIAAGKIAGFDLRRAQGMPGVLAVITPDNAPRLKAGEAAGPALHEGLLQNAEVLYQGQNVALVVAATLDQAIDAASHVGVRYNGGEAVTQMESAMSSAYRPKDFRNGSADPDSRLGDPDAAFAAAAVRVEATYVTPIEHHNPMEPHATVAAWDGGKLTVWSSTQGISAAHKAMAAAFGVAPGDVTILCPYLGGGFGCKGNTWPPAVLAAMAARVVKRPVKLAITREQMFTSNGYRPRTVQKIRLAADAQGKLTAIRHDGITQMSMPSLGEFAEPVAMATRMLYSSPNIATSHRLVAVNQGLPTYMRAPGEASGMFALESAMDELAVALKIDPLELRMRNNAETDPTENKPFASKGLLECYRQGAEAFGWSKRTPEPMSMREGNVLVGYGMATSTYPTNRMPASARVRLLPDGTALVQAGSQDIGTGTYTVITQLAADELGLPMERVRVELGDSRLPPAPVSGGSMTVASILPAVQGAAQAARQALFRMASAHGPAAWRGLNDADLQWQDGNVTAAGASMGVRQLLAAAGAPYVEGRVDAKPDASTKSFSRHAFGAHFVEVRVDATLGIPRIARWVGAFDCGRLMNTKTGRSQLIGGITYGIGMALHEETRVDGETGRIINANIAEYLVPVNADIPDLQVITVDAPDLVTTKLGPKGIGELPMVGAAPAIANAIYHATGKRVRELPIRIENLLV